MRRALIVIVLLGLVAFGVWIYFGGVEQVVRAPRRERHWSRTGLPREQGQLHGRDGWPTG